MPGRSCVALDIEKAERQASSQIHHGDNYRPHSSDLSSSSGSGSTISAGQATQGEAECHRIEVERERTHLSTHSNPLECAFVGLASKGELPPFGGGKEYPPPLPHRDRYLVDFSGKNDPIHGQNWPLKKKYVLR